MVPLLDAFVGTVIIALMQKNCREKKVGAQRMIYQMIGYDIYTVKDEKTKMDAIYYKANKPFDYNIGGDCREVVKIWKLTPGSYCVVPYTHQADCAGEFALRIFSEHPLG